MQQFVLPYQFKVYLCRKKGIETWKKGRFLVNCPMEGEEGRKGKGGMGKCFSYKFLEIIFVFILMVFFSIV